MRSVYLIFAIIGISCIIKCEIINTKINQIINVESQLVKVKSFTTIQNLGPNEESSYIYVIEPEVKDFYVNFENDVGSKLHFVNDKTPSVFRIFLETPLKFNETCVIAAEIVYINCIGLLYKTITFTQDQYVTYSGNLLHYSQYKTLVLEKKYIWKKTPANLQLSHPANHKKNETCITYRYSDIDPFSYEEFRLQFLNNKPFLVVTNLRRFIDISHFGGIYVEDRIAIKNEGSKLTGPYEHQSSNIIKEASVWWLTYLPTAAENVQYFDIIGNSSKSILLHFKNYKALKFQPRYFLLGGWRASYVIRYYVPTYEYLYHNQRDHFVLRMRGVDHIVNDVVIRRATVEVLLPEGAQIAGVDVPYGFDRLNDDKRYTSLCVFGRPTVLLRGSNIVENHIAYFRIEYLFSSAYLMKVPLILILYVLSLFIIVICILRMKQSVSLLICY